MSVCFVTSLNQLEVIQKLCAGRMLVMCLGQGEVYGPADATATHALLLL